MIIEDTYSSGTIKCPKFCKESIKFLIIFYFNFGHQLFHLMDWVIIRPAFNAIALSEKTLISIGVASLPVDISVCCHLVPALLRFSTEFFVDQHPNFWQMIHFFCHEL